MSSSVEKEGGSGDTVATGDHDRDHSKDVDDTEYPTGLKFIAILIAIILTMFLVRDSPLLIGSLGRKEEYRADCLAI